MTLLPPSMRLGEDAGRPADLFRPRGRLAVLILGGAALLLAHLLTGLPGLPSIPLWSPAAASFLRRRAARRCRRNGPDVRDGLKCCCWVWAPAVTACCSCSPSAAPTRPRGRFGACRSS